MSVMLLIRKQNGSIAVIDKDGELFLPFTNGTWPMIGEASNFIQNILGDVELSYLGCLHEGSHEIHGYLFQGESVKVSHKWIPRKEITDKTAQLFLDRVEHNIPVDGRFIALSRAIENGGMTCHQIALELEVDLEGAFILLSRLVEQGWLEKKQSQHKDCYLPSLRGFSLYLSGAKEVPERIA